MIGRMVTNKYIILRGEHLFSNRLTNEQSYSYCSAKQKGRISTDNNPEKRIIVILLQDYERSISLDHGFQHTSLGLNQMRYLKNYNPENWSA